MAADIWCCCIYICTERYVLRKNNRAQSIERYSESFDVARLSRGNSQNYRAKVCKNLPATESNIP